MTRPPPRLPPPAAEKRSLRTPPVPGMTSPARGLVARRSMSSRLSSSVKSLSAWRVNVGVCYGLHGMRITRWVSSGKSTERIEQASSTGRHRWPARMPPPQSRAPEVHTCTVDASMRSTGLAGRGGLQSVSRRGSCARAGGGVWLWRCVGPLGSVRVVEMHGTEGHGNAAPARAGGAVGGSFAPARGRCREASDIGRHR